jgi:hypothetical protein
MRLRPIHIDWNVNRITLSAFFWNGQSYDFGSRVVVAWFLMEQGTSGNTWSRPGGKEIGTLPMETNTKRTSLLASSILVLHLSGSIAMSIADWAATCHTTNVVFRPWNFLRSVPANNLDSLRA